MELQKKRARHIPDRIEKDGDKEYLIRQKIVKVNAVVDEEIDGVKEKVIKEIEKVSEIKYRIDAAFRPTHPEEICEEYMRNYVKAKGVDAVKWYKSLWPTKDEVAAGAKRYTLREITNKFIEDKEFGLAGSVERLSRRSKQSIVAEDLDNWLAANTPAGKKK